MSELQFSTSVNSAYFVCLIGLEKKMKKTFIRGCIIQKQSIIHTRDWMTSIYLTKVYKDLKKLPMKKKLPLIEYLESTPNLTFVPTKSSHRWNTNKTTFNFDVLNTSKSFIYDICTLNSLLETYDYMHRDPEKMVSKLINEANIINFMNCNTYHLEIHDQIVRGSDSRITWLIFRLKLKQSKFIYRDYGCRKDKTYKEKIEMFNMFYEVAKINLTDNNLLSSCLKFSDDIEEVKLFMVWMSERSESLSSLVYVNSIGKFGTKLFDFFNANIGIQPDAKYINVLYEPKFGVSIDESLKTLRHIAKIGFVHGTNLPTNTIICALDHQNLELIQILMELGAPVNENLFRTLVINTYFESEEKYDYIFVTECIDLILKSSTWEIPHKDGYYDYQNRKIYRFNGKIYDWLIETQPKMHSSLQRRKEYEFDNGVIESRYSRPI